MATQKKQFAEEAMQIVDWLVAVREKLPEFENAYFDKTWNSGGGDEIIDADLTTEYTFTAAELGSMITLVQQLQKFFGNTAVTTGDYAATINKMKFGRSSS